MLPELTITALIFPSSWKPSARAMAEKRGMTQQDVDAIENDLQTFRAQAAEHALERKDDDAAFEARWAKTYSKYSWSGDCDTEAVVKFQKAAKWGRALKGYGKGTARR